METVATMQNGSTKVIVRHEAGEVFPYAIYLKQGKASMSRWNAFVELKDALHYACDTLITESN